MLQDGEITSRIEEELRHALGTGDIKTDRDTVMDYYHAEKKGVLAHPGAGRSSVVMPTVREHVEAVVPSIMDVFVSSPQAVRFEPETPADIDAAAQETAYLNYVFYRQNDGYSILQTAIKDGLLSKNGYIKFFWEQPAPLTTTLTNLDDIALAGLGAMDKVEILEISEPDEEGFIAARVARELPGKISISNPAPENMKVSSDARNQDLQNVRFVAEHTQRTVSDLVMEWPEREEEIRMLAMESDDEERGGMRTRRNQSDEDPYQPHDKGTQPVEFVECYYLLDVDEDGVSERRLITVAGGSLVLQNEPIDYVPFVSWTPMMEPHKHIGTSLADVLVSYQEIDTTIVRQMLDNAYLTNNPEKEVVEEWLAPDGLDDLMASRPGGIKRVEQPNAIREIVTPFTAGQMLPFLEFLDGKKQDVSGVRADMLSMNPNVLAQANTGVVSQALDSAMARTKLFARNFAEMALRPLFLGMHKLLLENVRESQIVKLRGRYVPIFPFEWHERNNMLVTVGLGSGSKEQVTASLGQVIQLQQTAMQAGVRIVDETAVYNVAVDFVQGLGLVQEPDRYFVNPEGMPPPEPDVQQQLLAAQQQIEQAQLQLQAQKQEAEAAIKAKDLELSQQRNLLTQQKQADEATDRRTKMELEYAQNVPGAGV